MTTTDCPVDYELHDGPLEELGVAGSYAVLALRVDVFVVEQDCAYAELDGRDLEPGAVHLVLNHAPTGTVAASLRSLRDEVDGQPVRRIGRVVTHRDHRGRGLAGWLVDRATTDQRVPVVLDAQLQLEEWYRARGFRTTGRGWLEDGIPHVPMRRDPPDGEPTPPDPAMS